MNGWKRSRPVLIVALITLVLSSSATAATKEWAAVGPNDNWSTPTNWSPVGVPMAGDDLVFGGLSTVFTSENDLPSNTSFNSITVVLSYSLTGNPIVLAGGVTKSLTGDSVIAFPIALTGGFPFQIEHTISVTAGTLTLSGVISGCSSAFSFCNLRKIGAGTLVLDDVNTYGGPTRIDGGMIDIKTGSALGAAAAGTIVADGASLQVSFSGTLTEPITLSGSGVGGSGALKVTAALNTIAAPVTLPADAVIGVSGSLTISDAVGGGAGLTKSGTGILQLGGSASNTYDGPTLVNEGTLELNKSGGAIAVPGTLVIGDGIGSNGADVVRLLASEQINSSRAVTIHRSGLFDVNHFNYTETIQSLTMTHGTISGMPATLVLGGDVTVTQADLSSGAAIGVSTLSLGGGTRVFTTNAVGTASVPALQVSSAIVDGGAASGVVKAGAASMQFSGSGSYTGPTTIAAGRLIVSNPSTPLGSPIAGTTIASSAALELRGVSVAEPLVVEPGAALLTSGAIASQCTGPIVILGVLGVTTGQPLDVVAPISGPGSLHHSGSLMRLSSTNTYQGSTSVFSGTLQGNAFDAIPDSSAVDVASGATLDLTGQIETIGTLLGAGAVTLGNGGKLTVGGNLQSSTFSGTLTGTGTFGGLVKTGTGVFTVAGTMTLEGGTTVDGGTLIVTGSMTGFIAVTNSSTLLGTGHVGNLTVFDGASVGPGSSPGTLAVDGDLSIADEATSIFELSAATTGNASDRLVVTGNVEIGGALNLTLEGTPAPGEVFTIIQNEGSDPILGAFGGFDFEGRLRVGDVDLQVSYVGGDGNDITLTAAVFSHYLAEGATSDFFDMQIALLNPNITAATVTLRFMKLDGSIVTSSLTMPPLSRRSVVPKALAGLEAAQFSTVVESSVPLVVDRTIRWDSSHYGSHTETSVPAPALKWYLAEGATHSGFNLFYLIQNANPTSADIAVTYLRPAPNPPVVKNYVVGANSRFNIWVNLEGLELEATDVSAVIDSNQPVIVERAMYLNSGGQYFGAGHESAGVAAPSSSWYLAEGATGTYFDLFVLIANPNDVPAEAMATYLLPDGSTIEKAYIVAANSRFNIWVDLEGPQLADTAVSTRIDTPEDVPVIVERAMWWPGGADTWAEAHNSAGATRVGARWGLAEGEQGGPSGMETYILLANSTANEAVVDVTLYFEDDTSAVRTYTVAPRSRFNVQVGTEFPEAAGRRFGTIVQSATSPASVFVVERAMYSNANGVIWAAGSNALATRLQ